MDKEMIVDGLDRLLVSLHRKLVMIRDSDGKIPDSDLSKAMEEVRTLYEQFTILGYLNTLPENTIAPAEKEIQGPFVPIIEKTETVVQPIIPSIPPIQEVVEEKLPEVVPVAEEPQKNEKETEAVVVESPREEIVITEEIKIEEIPSVSIQHIEEAPIVEKIQEKRVVEEVQANPVEEIPQPKEEKPRLGGTMENMTLADRLRLQKIEDIHKAVSLSDKFLYINELFKGDIVTYKEMIDEINAFGNHDQASDLLDRMSDKYGWHAAPKTEKKLRELVLRRFL